MASAPVPLANLGPGYTIITQVIPSPTEQQTSNQHGSVRKFLRGEPKALGTVQIIIGSLTLLLGIVLSIHPQSIVVYIGHMFWGSLIHISSGSLTVSASRKLNTCVIKGALVMNIFSTIVAIVSIIILSMDLVFRGMFRYCYRNNDDYICNNNVLQNIYNGVYGILLVLSVLLLCISIAVSVFSCKATGTNQPTLNSVSVVTNHERCATVVSYFPPTPHPPPPPPDLPGVNMMPGVIMEGGFPTDETPPAYCEKSQPDH